MEAAVKSAPPIRRASLFGRGGGKTGHCWATPAGPRPGGNSSFIEEWPLLPYHLITGMGKVATKVLFIKLSELTQSHPKKLSSYVFFTSP